MANIDTKELEKLPTIITDVENSKDYSKDINHINKPIKNIKFGHLLNINCDNLAGAFTLIKKFLAEGIYKQDVDNKNTAAKIVCRNADKSIEVGDIYSNSELEEIFEAGSGIAFKGKDGVIRYCKNYENFFKIVKPNPKFEKNRESGYRISDDGFIEQWMYFPSLNEGWHGRIINFPIPFPNDCLNIIVGRNFILRASGNDSEGVGAVYRDKTSFILQADVRASGAWIRALGY